MPPKIGPRPKDFDETMVRRSPTFQQWMALQPGTVLEYSGHSFTKGKSDDEERLMRRIMMVRRKNLANQDKVNSAKRARYDASLVHRSGDRTTRRTNDDYLNEMDVAAVEATRSYKKWAALPDGATFKYNGRVAVKGVEGDWMLKKNIWRRMAHRRSNKVMVENYQAEPVPGV